MSWLIHVIPTIPACLPAFVSTPDAEYPRYTFLSIPALCHTAARMQPSVIVWDLETVPDLGGFAAANDLVGKVALRHRPSRSIPGSTFDNTGHPEGRGDGRPRVDSEQFRST
jgi:hypothetical protein